MIKHVKNGEMYKMITELPDFNQVLRWKTPLDKIIFKFEPSGKDETKQFRKELLEFILWVQEGNEIIKLPEYSECDLPENPLEIFIKNNEPLIEKNAEDFRNELFSVYKWLKTRIIPHKIEINNKLQGASL